MISVILATKQTVNHRVLFRKNVKLVCFCSRETAIDIRQIDLSKNCATSYVASQISIKVRWSLISLFVRRLRRNVNNALTNVDWERKGCCYVGNQNTKIEDSCTISFPGVGVNDKRSTEYFSVSVTATNNEVN